MGGWLINENKIDKIVIENELLLDIVNKSHSNISFSSEISIPENNII